MGIFNSTIVTVSSKGWVVIPSLFRRKIGLKPGMKMEVTETEGKIVLTPQVGDPVDELYGRLAGGESLTAALLADRAEEREHEQAEIPPR
ncbi:MAG: AbrB/MazE/SpoVT family DNA-binding domain-containing protein [Syntrophaceae bacterium]|nr:AbrB/MazE/SpoVT family DNA-binding domain-containing protein [Patescibacteria group bacterium]MBU3931769.1 AbrB/MazE/SpoVT family DNA-binding domain-containing protein [Pseudomonadota bacterium]MBU4372321.1 AbrB/MazE/SpoVT family DNA-binding domain-containing protein [Pseudomonadota bacterium]MCG2741090.1 AbrB/MazE/SpoVT family DNA-binding domain-containing protein [Syntrophaceae bacterium]